jgi:hypothetical protein
VAGWWEAERFEADWVEIVRDVALCAGGTEMTERPGAVAAAREAEARGEAAAAAGDARAEQMQSSIAGSQTAFDPAPERPDATAVGWTGTSVEPPAISPPPMSAPNVHNPLDNNQAY